MCIAVNGRAVGQLVRVTLYSSLGDEKVYAANYLSDRWVKLLFDITDCIFLCDITKIRIAFYGKGKEINKNEFGYIGEVSFEKGNFLSLIKTDGVTLAFSAILGFICYKETLGIIEIIRVAVVISATILFMF